MKLDLTTSPTKEDAQIIRQGLVDSNIEAIGDIGNPDLAIDFSIFARDDDEKVIGGLRASYFWDALHIQLVWVSKEFRNKGIATNLLKKAETYAIERGAEQCLLGTTDWQAKPLYDKLGYETITTISGHPKDHKMYYMIKKLSK